MFTNIYVKETAHNITNLLNLKYFIYNIKYIKQN